MKRTKRASAKPMERLAARVAGMSPEQRDRLAALLHKGPPVTEQLRMAIEASELSRYALWKATGVDQGQLSKFMGGTAGLSLDNLDKLCAVLGLELRARKNKGG